MLTLRKYWIAMLLVGVLLVAAFIPYLFSDIEESSIGFLEQSKPVLSSPKGRSFLRIKNSTELNPGQSGDFLFCGWFRLEELPDRREKARLFSKFDGKRSGFSVALDLDANGIRPMVYWNDSNDTGRWYSFSEITALRRHWLLLCLSFSEGKYIGLHAAGEALGRSSAVKLLGGYELDPVISANSGAPLEIGSVGKGNFKGDVGPVLVAVQDDIASDLKVIMEDLVLSPLERPSLLKKDSIKLWLKDAPTDHSGVGQEIKVRKRGRK